MSSFRFLSVNLLGGSLLLLLTAVCEAQYYDSTPSPDYDSDYNATFEYSFYSNTSIDDLDILSEQLFPTEVENLQEGTEDTGGQEVVTVTMETTTKSSQKTRVFGGAASFPGSLDLRTLVWTLTILMVLNSQQL